MHAPNVSLHFYWWVCLLGIILGHPMGLCICWSWWAGSGTQWVLWAWMPLPPIDSSHCRIPVQVKRKVGAWMHWMLSFDQHGQQYYYSEWGDVSELTGNAVPVFLFRSPKNYYEATSYTSVRTLQAYSDFLPSQQTTAFVHFVFLLFNFNIAHDNTSCHL